MSYPLYNGFRALLFFFSFLFLSRFETRSSTYSSAQGTSVELLLVLGLTEEDVPEPPALPSAF